MVAAGGKLRTPGSAIRLADPQVDRVVQSLERRIDELSKSSNGRLYRDFELRAGEENHIRHGLGRPAHVFVSPPKNKNFSGSITIVQDSTTDENNVAVLYSGGSVDVLVDVWIL